MRKLIQVLTIQFIMGLSGYSHAEASRVSIAISSDASAMGVRDIGDGEAIYRVVAVKSVQHVNLVPVCPRGENCLQEEETPTPHTQILLELTIACNEVMFTDLQYYVKVNQASNRVIIPVGALVRKDQRLEGECIQNGYANKKVSFVTRTPGTFMRNQIQVSLFEKAGRE